jgi:Autotransporter beta-domain
VLLNLTAGLGSGSGLNPNQQNVANAINNFFNAGGTLPANFSNLFGLTGGALGTALTQLDGEAPTGAERAVFQLDNQFLTLMLDPFVNGRGNVGGGPGGPAFGFAPEQRDNLPPDIALAYASILTKAPPVSFEQRWTAWGSAYGGANNANGDPAAGTNNVRTSTFGFAGGMDYHLTPTTVVGFALAGAGTNWGLANALGGGRSDALQAGAYGISWFGSAYIAGAVSFSNHWFTTNRSALGDAVTASFVGQGYGARLESGYRYAVLPAFAVTPYGAVQFQDFHTPAYNETDTTGGGLGLAFASMNATDVRTELGARFDDPTVIYNKPLILFGRLAWAHDFVSNPFLSAAFQALPGAAPSRSTARRSRTTRR